MLFHISLYVGLGLVMVAAMALMILKIGKLLGDCPVSVSAARVGSVTIATGYAMVGLGGVVLIGAVIPMLEGGLLSLLPALGLVAICLGLGFSHAVATLRAVVREAVQGTPSARPAEKPKSAPPAEMAHPA